MSFKHLSLYAFTHNNFLITDKICIDNGSSIHEFEVIDNHNPSSLAESLQKLPKTNSEEYVRTWCNTQLPITTPTHRRQSDASAIEECDSLGSSLSETEFKKPSDVFVTYRKKNEEPDSSGFVYDKCRKLSRESGILTLPDSVSEYDNEAGSPRKLVVKVNASSDYCTCDSQQSINVLERNVIESSVDENVCDSTKNESVTNELEKNGNRLQSLGSSDLSFVTVSEVYKYRDVEEGITLYEKRLLKNPGR